MNLGKVIGTVTATAKDPQLVGGKLLLADVVDAAGATVEPSVVAIDTVGAGVGDTVLIVRGSAARLPAATASLPIDAAIVAVVEQIAVSR